MWIFAIKSGGKKTRSAKSWIQIFNFWKAPLSEGSEGPNHKSKGSPFQHVVSSAFLDQTYLLFTALSFSPRR